MHSSKIVCLMLGANKASRNFTVFAPSALLRLILLSVITFMWCLNVLLFSMVGIGIWINLDNAGIHAASGHALCCVVWQRLLIYAAGCII